MRTRFENKWDRTRGGLKIDKIKKIVNDFPLLHAYGIGFAMFGSIPEHTRRDAVDYSRYMLAFELDDEIDAGVMFLKALGGVVSAHNDCYLRSEYLLHLYSYWRLELLKAPEIMPLGVLAVSALMLNGSVRVLENLKPNYLIGVSREKRIKVEKYLAFTKNFQKWPEEQTTWSFANNG